MNQDQHPIARKHHYVPQFYLSSFSVPRRASRKVEVFDLVLRKQFPSNTRDIARSVDFNRVQIDGKRPDYLESELSKLENEIALSLEEVVHSRSLSVDKHKQNILLLVSLLAIRTPRFRAAIKKMHVDVGKLIVETSLSSEKRWSDVTASWQDCSSLQLPTYAEIKQQYDRGDFEVDYEIDSGYYIKKEFKLLPSVVEMISLRNWCLLSAPSDTGGFVTSDHPFILRWSRSVPRHYSPGLGLKHTIVSFPLSPALKLVGTFEELPHSGTLNLDQVAAENGVTITTAERQVFSRDMNFVYSVPPYMSLKKASRLIGDRSLRRE
jgi:hypothetical protein